MLQNSYFSLNSEKLKFSRIMLCENITKTLNLIQSQNGFLDKIFGIKCSVNYFGKKCADDFFSLILTKLKKLILLEISSPSLVDVI